MKLSVRMEKKNKFIQHAEFINAGFNLYMTYSTTRGPLALCLAVFGFALLGVCGYLIWLTISEYETLLTSFFTP